MKSGKKFLNNFLNEEINIIDNLDLKMFHRCLSVCVVLFSGQKDCVYSGHWFSVGLLETVKKAKGS